MKKSDSNELIKAETDFEIVSLRKRIQEIESENQKLKQILKENDLEEYLDGIVQRLTDEEFICVNEIRKLKELSEKGLFTENEAKVLDILYKNLRSIRGLQPAKETKQKKADVSELFKIVESPSK